MSAPCITMAQLNKLSPCAESGRRVRAALRKFNADKGHCFTAAEAREAGCTFEDVVWAASAASLNDKGLERRLRHWMADCAARVLHIYERERPEDMRVRAAIQAAHDFADGRSDAAARDAARAAAWAAARAAAWAAAGDAARDAARAAAWAAARAAAWAAAGDAAWAAARAAAWDAAWAAARAAARDAARDAARAAARDAARDAARAAAWDAAWAAARAAARDAARAAARAAAGDAARAAARAAAGGAEEQWQFDQLIAWLSDPEPEPLALPALPERIAA
jgi:hypothetical protein